LFSLATFHILASLNVPLLFNLLKSYTDLTCGLLKCKCLNYYHLLFLKKLFNSASGCIFLNSLFISSKDFYFFKVSNYSEVILYCFPSAAVILKSLVLVPLAIALALKCPTAPLETPAKAEQPAAMFYQSLTVRDSLLANLAQDALDSGDKALAADKAVTILGTYLTKVLATFPAFPAVPKPGISPIVSIATLAPRFLKAPPKDTDLSDKSAPKLVKVEAKPVPALIAVP